MFRMEKIRGGSVYGKYLEEHLDYSDYVGEKEKIVGQWFGNLADDMQITGACQGAKDERFKYLCDGKHPLTGEKILSHEKEEGVRFYDFQCSAQKSVSILAVTLGDTRLVAEHNNAVGIALVELEKFAGYQAGKGMNRGAALSGNVIGGRFTHLNARPDAGGGPADPQLHTHCAIANVTLVGERFFALNEYEMVRAIRYAGKVYQNEMAERVEKLGYDIEFKHGANGSLEGYEIKGVSKEIMDNFSKRSAAVNAAIEKFTAENGRAPSNGELRVIKRETRGEKAEDLSQDELVQLQRDQLPADAVAKLTEIRDDAKKLVATGPRESKRMNVRQAVKEATDHLFERESVLPRHALLAEALAQNLGQMDLDALKAETANNEILVPLTTARPSEAENRGNEWKRAGELLGIQTATAEGLQEELRAIKWARQSAGTLPPFVAKEGYRPFGGSNEVMMDGKKADVSEQREVAEGVLASQDRYLSLRGVAGAGKTTVLPEIHNGLVVGGYRPMYLAPTTAARDVLRAQGFNAGTVQEFLQDMKNTDITLPEKTVLVVDEGGLASNKMGAALMRHAEREQARVLFVGDTKQHTSVEAGDFVRILEENAPIKKFTLGKIQRQKVEAYREAMQTAARGNSQEAVKQLDAIGWVIEGKGNYLKNAARDFVAKMREHGNKNVLGVAPTNAEVDGMTSMIRKELKELGRVGEEVNRTAFKDYGWTAQQRRNIDNYRPGLAVSVSTGKIGPLKQNDLGKVKEVNREKRTATISLPDGTDYELKITKMTVQNLAVGESCELPLAPGDSILITANNTKAKLTNGEVLTVRAVKEDGVIETTSGKIIPRDFVYVTHGYVVTSHKSQGKTVDHVIVAADQLTPKGAYVSLSRGRQSATLHTAEKEYLLTKLPATNRGRTAATDLQPAPDEPVRGQIPTQARRQYWNQLVSRANHTAAKTKALLKKASIYLQQRKSKTIRKNELNKL